MKQKDVIGARADQLFNSNSHSPVVNSFMDPAKTKSPGLHTGQVLVLPDGNKEQKDILIIRTDLKDELHFSMVVL